jgi:hypothetical protein
MSGRHFEEEIQGRLSELLPLIRVIPNDKQ